MKSKRNLILAALTLISFGSTSAQSLVEAPLIVDCRVPICDVDARLQQLRAMTSQERANAILEEFRSLADRYSRSPDAATWENLVEYSSRTRDLTIELKDDDYVTRETVNLLDLSLLGMHKFGPLTLENLVSTYRQIKTRRYEALSFWGTVESNEKYQEVSVIIAFLMEARKISATENDPDWMQRKIEELLATASRRLSSLDPIGEGYYRIVFTPAADAPLHCKPTGELPTKLFIGNAMTSNGIVASFTKESGTPYAFFKNLVFSGDLDAVRSSSISFATSSVFSMRLKKESGEVEGLFRNSRLSCTYKFVGRRLRSPGAFLRDGAVAGQPSFADLLGVYEFAMPVVDKYGVSTVMKGTLVLRDYRQVGGLTLSATAFFSETHLLDFEYGYYVEPRGFFILNFSMGDNALVRWHLAYRPDAQGNYAWRGFTMSFLNGVVNDVSMRKIGNLSDVDDGLIGDRP